eukprot:SAG31_NODE_314_length_17854_cov_3.932075_15_plen_81_part_00
MGASTAFRFKSGSDDNLLNFKEFLRGLKHLNIEMPEEKARLFFDYVDKSGDGRHMNSSVSPLHSIFEAQHLTAGFLAVWL